MSLQLFLHMVSSSINPSKLNTSALLVGGDGGLSYVREYLFSSCAHSIPLHYIHVNVTSGYIDAGHAIFACSNNTFTNVVVRPDCATFVSAQESLDLCYPETW